MLAGEARLGAILVNGRRPDGQRCAQWAHGLRDPSFSTRSSPEATASTTAPESATPFGSGSAARTASPRPTAFEPKTASSRAFSQGDDAPHPITVTSPASPSTRTATPSPIRSVPSRVPTTPGIPYSRATIAACDSRPPLSVTRAPSRGKKDVERLARGTR